MKFELFFIFLQNTVPWMIFCAFGAITAYFVIRDRYSRRLTLKHSQEEERLDALAAAGKIDAETLALLKSKCHPLPRVEEESPLPDIPLRIAAAFTMTYAGGAILFIISKIIIFLYGNNVISELHPGTKEGLPVTGCPILMIVFSCACAIILCIMFAAGHKILSGSIKARNICAATWLLVLPSIIYGLAWMIMTLGTLLIVSYIIFFRKNASRAISIHAAEASPIKKIIYAAIIGTFILPAWYMCVFKAVLNGNHGIESDISSSFVSSSFNVFSCRLRKVFVFIQTPGTPADAFAAAFRKKLLETHPSLIVMTTDQPETLAEFDPQQDIILLVSYSTRSIYDVNFTHSIIKDLTDLCAAGKHVIKITTLFRCEGGLLKWNGMTFPNVGSNFKGEYSFDSTALNNTASKIGIRAAENFSTSNDRSLSEDAEPIIPENLPRPEYKIPPIAIEGLREFKQALATSTMNDAGVAIYTFRTSDQQKDEGLINAAFTKLGMMRNDIKDNKNYVTGKGKEINGISLAANVYLNDEISIIAITAFSDANRNTNQPGFDFENFTRQFKEESPSSFVMCGGLATLDKNERNMTAKTVTGNKNLKLRIRLGILMNLTANTLDRETFSEIIIQLANETASAKIYKEQGSDLMNLIDKVSDDPEMLVSLTDAIAKANPKVICVIDMNDKAPNANGMICETITAQGKSFVLILKLIKPNGEAIFIPIEKFMNEKGILSWQLMNSTTTGVKKDFSTAKIIRSNASSFTCDTENTPEGIKKLFDFSKDDMVIIATADKKSPDTIKITTAYQAR